MTKEEIIQQYRIRLNSQYFGFSEHEIKRVREFTLYDIEEALDMLTDSSNQD